MKSLLIACCLCITTIPAFSQSKNALDHADFAIWNQISNRQIAHDGTWVTYEIVPGEGDRTLVLYHVPSAREHRYPRGKQATITEDGTHIIFTLSPPEDTLKAQRRRKVEKEQLPSDTLAIFQTGTGAIQKIPDLENTYMPERWSGYLIYQVRPAVEAKTSASTEENENGENKPEAGEPPIEKTEKKEKKTKTPSKKNGYHLIVRDLSSSHEDTLQFVTDVALSKYGQVVAAHSTGRDSTLKAGVHMFRCAAPGWQSVKSQKGTYKNLSWSEQGDRLVFTGDTDTTKAQIKSYELFHWQEEMDSAQVLVKHFEHFMTDDWQVSEHYKPRFSADGKTLHFGIAPKPLVEDTTLLDEEKVNVEVWHYQDARLYTQQIVRAKSEKERAYHGVIDLATGHKRQVANEHLPESRMDRDYNSAVIVLYDERPYLREMSWKGETWRDVWVYDLHTGRHRMVAQGVEGMPQLSPGFAYVWWYHGPDSSWHVSPVTGSPVNVSASIPVSVSNELNDVPANPNAYGIAGWLNEDDALLIYDRFDLWKVNPKGTAAPVNLTNGREAKLRYRYVRLDPDERAIDPSSTILLHTFNETTKASGYAELDLASGTLRHLLSGDLRYDSRPLKARDADVMIYTAESFRQFPDLMITADRFKTSQRISDVNPQQKDYRWGTIELYTWTAYDGQQLQGLLVKPDNFDPGKQYPLLVNFYERSSDELHQHRTPFPHRSTINYPFYTSRGYVIFNPDVPYKTGYPGESAYNSAVSGTEALIREGFINPRKVGIQGHSWGGYQIAHILTRTGIYACAESGAPVVNMVSAYGGIRWETGLSRMFQYEHTQSRIGGSLWEKPGLYLENSPIFQLDKVTTPVLIMHNDSDGHVPWYQGIEFFVAMRRLGKPAWMLNYPGEPHWPLKLQNRKDFNIRMQQFFDHYLLDAPMPVWMRDGVPAVEKGIRQGYELLEK